MDYLTINLASFKYLLENEFCGLYISTVDVSS